MQSTSNVSAYDCIQMLLPGDEMCHIYTHEIGWGMKPPTPHGNYRIVSGDNLVIVCSNDVIY